MPWVLRTKTVRDLQVMGIMERIRCRATVRDHSTYSGKSWSSTASKKKEKSRPSTKNATPVLDTYK